jgi:hypothetical protein
LFIWQDAIKKNYKNILVLEDDVQFTDDFNEYLENVMEELPKDYDILYLGYFEKSCFTPKNNNFNYLYKPDFLYGTHAMIISNKGLKKLLKIITKVNDHIDSIISYNKDKLNIYTSKKKIADQLWFDSNNSNLKNKAFPKIINFCLNKIYDCNNVPLSFGYNLQLYKYKNYIISGVTYSIFSIGIIANIHENILLLCLLYFAYDYDRFHLIVFFLGYLFGNIFKYGMKYCKLNQYTVLFLFILLIIFINITNIPFTLIKNLL